VNETVAIAQNLTFASADAFVLRADSTNTVSSSARGRNSVRIQSYSQYTTHVAVFNVRHMPAGCGTWPAIWEVGDNWPNEGEVRRWRLFWAMASPLTALCADGHPGGCERSRQEPGDVAHPHRYVASRTTVVPIPPHPFLPPSLFATQTNLTVPSAPLHLHARRLPIPSLGCTMPAGRTLHGTVVSTDCEWYTGCGVRNHSPRSFGPKFNAAGGGWFAVERTDAFIKVHPTPPRPGETR
jgi:hypothetical protein